MSEFGRIQHFYITYFIPLLLLSAFAFACEFLFSPRKLGARSLAGRKLSGVLKLCHIEEAPPTILRIENFERLLKTNNPKGFVVQYIHVPFM